MDYYSFSEIGQRASNEDALVLKELSNGLFLVAVVDGCGAAGGVALLVAEKLENDLLDCSYSETVDGLTSILANKVIDVNNYIEDYRRYFPKLGCCCLTVAVINPNDNNIALCHIGDTRAYLCHDGGVSKVTRDHSPVGRMLDCGAITEGDAIHHPNRNRIDRALGMQHLPHESNYVYTKSLKYSVGDTIMLCTDGIYDPLYSHEIQECLSRKVSDRNKAEELFEIARQSGSTDNATIIVVTL